MGMFHTCDFPIYKDGKIEQRSYVIRDGRYEDIIHDFVKSGTKLMVEDWNTESCDNVVLRKQGCVWVVTDLEEGPSELPESYYEFVDIFRKNRSHAARTHPFL